MYRNGDEFWPFPFEIHLSLRVSMRSQSGYLHLVSTVRSFSVHDPLTYWETCSYFSWFELELRKYPHFQFFPFLLSPESKGQFFVCFFYFYVSPKTESPGHLGYTEAQQETNNYPFCLGLVYRKEKKCYNATNLTCKMEEIQTKKKTRKSQW